MKKINLDREWTFRRGFLDSVGMLGIPGETVNLPHDSMISKPVSPKAEAGVDSGYFCGDTCNYTKQVFIPEEWKTECIGLSFDGAMMHVTMDVNGFKVAEHHYGYSPFYVDITDYVAFGEDNRITINANSGIQPSSRWYTGCGLFRSVELCHGPKLYVPVDGVYLRTKEVSDGYAFIEAQTEVVNRTQENRLAEVTVVLSEEGSDECAAESHSVIQVNPGTAQTAHMTVNLPSPKLWDADSPNLYTVSVSVRDKGIFRTHLIAEENGTVDTESTIFGVRTITADSVRGLRINGKTVKLKGGCLHHDNGLLGSISLYESEVRKIKKLKEVGFNAVRTAHNPPSAALVEACDRVGMYIFDEAFDAWGIAKRVGDYSQSFSKYWKEDLTAFIKRDRIHPSVIIWSTGNEIPERGGLNNGYSLAAQLADTIHKLDPGRPVSNGICSFWSGLDDYLATGRDQSQNAKDESRADFWEKGTEAFTNGLDIVGYNYMEELYERDHVLYPERVILGSENFPKEIGFRWPVIESLPYVIGDFTWTCWDYIGEAGIGKALYVDKDDPLVDKKPWEIMPQSTSPYPYRCADDADFDITGRLLAQGAYRSVVWGSEATQLYSFSPDKYGKIERMSMWGFPGVEKCWNYRGFEGQPVELMVFSNADEIEFAINGKWLGRKAVTKTGVMPGTVRFETVFTPGRLEAVGYRDGKIVSRDFLETSEEPAGVVLTPEKTLMKADGHDVIYVGIDVVDGKGRPVTDAEINLSARIEGAGVLAGFGTGNPVTEEDYTDNLTKTFRGHATAIIRSGYEEGPVKLVIGAEGLGEAEEVVKAVRV